MPNERRTSFEKGATATTNAVGRSGNRQRATAKEAPPPPSISISPLPNTETKKEIFIANETLRAPPPLQPVECKDLPRDDIWELKRLLLLLGFLWGLSPSTENTSFIPPPSAVSSSIEKSHRRRKKEDRRAGLFFKEP